jgi:hypothetical protein
MPGKGFFNGLVGAHEDGDLNGDSDVDLGDLAELLTNYGMTGRSTYEQGDLDCDGDVDLADLAELLGHWRAADSKPMRRTAPRTLWAEARQLPC